MRRFLIALALLLTAPGSADAKGWDGPARFAGHADTVPRTAIAADGTSLTAWERPDGALVASEGDKHGRFAAPLLVTRRHVSDFAVAARIHQETAVAYEAEDGLHVAVRAGRGWKDHRIPSSGSEINGVQLVPDAPSGWVVAERWYPPRGGGKDYHVRAVSLDDTGRPTGPAQDLGAGHFGIDARVAKALGVLSDGRAVLVFERESGLGVLVSTRPRGGSWSPPAELGSGLTDPSFVVRGNHGYVGAVVGQSCGDAGCSGAPVMSVIGPDGAASAPAGPKLDDPRRAFAATAGPDGVAFLLKNGPHPFSREAAVYFAPPGGAARLVSGAVASEPAALILHPGTLVLWTTRAGFGAERIAGGRAHPIAPPPGPPPDLYHFNPTNRDYASAGWYVIAAWARGHTVRVSVRRF
jgi:hypothetical protein